MKVLTEQRIKVIGNLMMLHSFIDGSILVSDCINGINKVFYKVSNTKIKIGKFKRGKFHYSNVNVLVKGEYGFKYVIQVKPNLVNKQLLAVA